MRGHYAIIQFGIVGCQQSMNDIHPKSVQRYPNMLGYPAGAAPRSTIGTSIGSLVLVQLPAMQQLTGNKTFPVVCDQYTIKQSPGQSHFLRSPERQLFPHLPTTQPTASTSPSFSPLLFSVRRHSNVVTERFVAV